MAGEIMTGVSAKLKPHLASAAPEEKLGVIVIGTVQGDIHDIGKDIVATMLDIAGFDVVDLGVDVKVDAFVTSGTGEARADHRHELPAHQRDRRDEEASSPRRAKPASAATSS